MTSQITAVELNLLRLNAGESTVIMDTATMYHVPPEIIIEICSQLPNPIDKVNFASTCKYIYPYVDVADLKHHSLMKKIVSDINSIHYKISSNKSKRIYNSEKCKYIHSAEINYCFDVLDVFSTREIKSLQWTFELSNEPHCVMMNTFDRYGLINVFIVKSRPTFYNKYVTRYNLDTTCDYTDSESTDSDSDSD